MTAFTCRTRQQRFKVIQAVAAIAVLCTTSATAGVAVVSAPILQPGPPQGPAQFETGVEAPVPALHWHPCERAQYKGLAARVSTAPKSRLQCTRADAPLDYDDPEGRSISLSMAMRPADRPERRIGSLFINPGGPGGPGSQFVDYFASRLGDRVLARFDIVGIDPRGIGRSTQMTCRPLGPIPRYPRDLVPLTQPEVSTMISFGNYFSRACAATANEITDHMTTADVARDFDLIRQAVGDETLTFYGLSYGTHLGATYAALFPDNIRAMILDAVLDPIAWSTGRDGSGPHLPVTTRTKGGVGAWETLVSAFAECDRVGKALCPLAGRVAEQWRAIVARLKLGPAKTRFGSLHYSDIVDDTLGTLYSPASYGLLFRQIGLVYRDIFEDSRTPPSIRASHSDVKRFGNGHAHPFGYRGPDLTRQGNAFTLPFESVLCADSINPRNPHVWRHAGVVADRRGPWFGRDWTWFSIICAHWPRSTHSDAFDGPWRTKTSSPLLLLGNLHDPATPISGARVTNSLFAGSRLLTVDQWGHGALGRSSCAMHRAASYLIDGVLPASGAVCQGNGPLFRHR